MLEIVYDQLKYLKYLFPKRILFCSWFNSFLNYLEFNFIWGLFPDKKFCKNLFSQQLWRSKNECQIVSDTNEIQQTLCVQFD